MGTWISAVMRSWSVPVGKVGDVHVRIHLSFLIVLFYFWAVQSSNPTVLDIGRGLAATGLILLSVIIHEVAHGLTSMHQALPARVLILLPIGRVTLMDNAEVQKREAGAEFAVAITGPLASLMLAILSAVVIWLIMPGFVIQARPLIS